MILSNRVYDILKYIALIFIPALVALYGTISKIWGLPYGVEITSTISAIGVFLGACLCLSSYAYNKEKGEK